MDSQEAHILLFGWRGWIGGQIKALIEAKGVKLTLSKIRVSNQAVLEEEITAVAPTHIISTIGRTHGVLENGTHVGSIDYLESLDKVEINVRDNLFAPMLMAMMAVKHNIHLTYLGTGCIFHYDEPYDFKQQFSESDLPNFKGSQYSTVKGFTDQLMGAINFKENILNVRIRMPISDQIESGRNLISKLLKYKNVIKVPNSMTNLDELLPVTLDMALTNKHGTIHLCNPGAITHDEILTMYRDEIDPKHTWTNIELEELLQKSDAKALRSNNWLNTDKLKEWYPDVMDITESIRCTFQRIKAKQQGKEKDVQKQQLIEIKDLSLQESE